MTRRISDVTHLATRHFDSVNLTAAHKQPPESVDQGVGEKRALSGTSEFSRPLVLTIQIRTGPQSQLREGHFTAGNRPTQDRFGLRALTFWTGHIPPPFPGNRGRFSFGIVNQKVCW